MNLVSSHGWKKLENHLVGLAYDVNDPADWPSKHFSCFRNLEIS